VEGIAWYESGDGGESPLSWVLTPREPSSGLVLVQDLYFFRWRGIAWYESGDGGESPLSWVVTPREPSSGLTYLSESLEGVSVPVSLVTLGETLVEPGTEAGACLASGLAAVNAWGTAVEGWGRGCL